MSTANEILNSIELRLRELRGEIETLSAARAELRPGRAVGSPERRLRSSEKDGRRTKAAKPGANDAGNHVAARKAARAATDGRGQPARRVGTHKRKAIPRRSTKITPDDVELLLAGTSGLSTSELAQRSNGDRDHVLMPLRKLEAHGQVRRSGQRRGTRWHVITDDDRIEHRAAELAAVSKRR